MDGKASYNEPQLLEQLAKGDERAFKKLYDEHAPAVLRIARRYLGTEAGEDLLHELFATIWTRRAEFTHVKNIAAYIATMTKSLALRHHKKVVQEALATTEFNERLSLDDTELYQLLDEVLAQLPPRQQEILHLAKVEGLTHEAIATLLEISPGTVHTHVSRAMKTLRPNPDAGN